MSSQTVVATVAHSKRSIRFVPRLTSAVLLVFAALAIWDFSGALYLGLGRTAPAYFDQIAFLALYVSVWRWLSADRSRYPGVADQYGGFAFFIFWPLFITFYFVQTRGWRRLAAAFALIVVFGFGISVVGYIVGKILLSFA